MWNIYILLNQTKGTVVNRALTSLHGGSLEITLTVPLTVHGADHVDYICAFHRPAQIGEMSSGNFSQIFQSENN